MPSWYNLFLATFGSLALTKWIEDRRPHWLVLAGFLGGISFLVKLSGFFFRGRRVLPAGGQPLHSPHGPTIGRPDGGPRRDHAGSRARSLRAGLGVGRGVGRDDSRGIHHVLPPAGSRRHASPGSVLDRRGDSTRSPSEPAGRFRRAGLASAGNRGRGGPARHARGGVVGLFSQSGHPSIPPRAYPRARPRRGNRGRPSCGPARLAPGTTDAGGATRFSRGFYEPDSVPLRFADLLSLCGAGDIPCSGRRGSRLRAGARCHAGDRRGVLSCLRGDSGTARLPKRLLALEAKAGGIGSAHPGQGRDSGAAGRCRHLRSIGDAGAEARRGCNYLGRPRLARSVFSGRIPESDPGNIRVPRSHRVRAGRLPGNVGPGKGEADRDQHAAPVFQPPLSETLDSLGRRFPEAETIDRFLVRWR